MMSIVMMITFLMQISALCACSRPAAPVLEPQSTVGGGIPLKPGITHVQLRSNAIETALKRQTKSAPLLKPPSVAPKPVQQQPQSQQHLPRLEGGGGGGGGGNGVGNTTKAMTTATTTTTIQMSQLNIKQPAQQHTTRNLNKTTSKLSFAMTETAECCSV